MNKYSIYCTAEQTKKAFKLGAPLSVITVKNEKEIEAYKAFTNGKRKNECTILDDFQQSGCCHLITNPTAEQMIGWLEEKGITVKIVKCDIRWFARPCSCKNADFNKDGYSSRKEATLAAINSALNYLIQMKGGNND